MSKRQRRSQRDLDRKELINQLLETRGVLVHEMLAHEQAGLITRRRTTTFQNESHSPQYGHSQSKSSTTQNSLVRAIIEDSTAMNPSNMLLSFPVSQFNSKKKAPVKLPIFRLPPIGNPTFPGSPTGKNRPSILNSSIGRNAQTPGRQQVTTSTSVSGRKFVSYHDKRNLRKSLIVLVNGLSNEEKESLIISLRLKREDIDVCIQNMKDRFVELASQSLSGDRTLVRDVIPLDEAMSVFNTAQSNLDAIKEQAKYGQQRGSSRGSPQPQVKANRSATNIDSLRAVSRGVNFQQVGISEQFQEYLTSDQMAALQMSSSHNFRTSETRGHSKARTLAPYGSSNGGTNGDHHDSHTGHSLSRQHSLPALMTPAASTARVIGEPTRKAKKKKKDKSVDSIDSLISSSDPKLLSKAFLASLLAVQKHSTLVKKSLETAQTMVTVDNSRAKDLVYMLGAERMATVLKKIMENETRRGFDAWRLFVQQEAQVERIGKLLRALVLRNIVVAFHQLVTRLMSQNFTLWKQFAEREAQRVQKARVVQATVSIQSLMRGCLARRRVKRLQQRRKYEQIYDATVRIQSLFRAKLQRWRYQRLKRSRLETAAAQLIQRVYRGSVARRRVSQLRLRRNRQYAATLIQKLMRARLARLRMRAMKENQRRDQAATKIQSLIRGFLTRQNLAKLIIDRARNHAATLIQKRIRGMVTRHTLHRKLKEITIYRETRRQAITKIQAVYRGYRDRIVVKIRLMQHRKALRRQHQAATRILTMMRGFLARRQLQQLRILRYQSWLNMAREWQETWSDEGNAWCYVNQVSGVSLWEPSRQGYTKADGRLVLYSGDIVDDPRHANSGNGGGGEGGDGGDDNQSQDTLSKLLAMADQADSEEYKAKAAAKMKGKKGWLSSALCSECNDRTAVRRCHDCNDDFCTKCFKSSHALGARRHHTFDMLGPKDCDECELVLAERFCVTCDENFCDKCWRQLHKHGKRVFHPYCDIDREGKVDPRIFTMDGDELAGGSSGYDGTYSQLRADNQRTNEGFMALSQQIAQYDSYGNPIDTSMAPAENYPSYGVDEYGNPVEGGFYDGSASSEAYASADGSEWQAYVDEQGYTYYYNNYTGESTYDPPSPAGGNYNY